MKSHRIRLLLLGAAIAAGPVAWAEEGDDAAPTAQGIAAAIDAYVQPFVEADHLSGNLLVAHGDTVVYERSFGMADFEHRVPVTPDTRFNIASVSKPMTLIAMIDLIGKQKLALADPLSKWLPGFPRGDEITVEHLARHRAGIAHRVTEPCDETVPQTAASMAKLAAQKLLTGEPGERYNYSSGGFSVLARVLELAGGKSYAELMQDTVFAPAGMPRSAHTNSRALLAGRASGYLPSPAGGIMNADLQDMSFLVGAGSIYSTARDLHALVQAVRTGKLGPGPQQSFVDDEGLDWNGVTNGFRAFADWHRASDVTVVFTGNLQTGAGNRIRADVPRIAAGERVEPPVLPQVKPVKLPADVLKRWEGIYELRPGSPLRVHVDDGTLLVNSWVLIPVGERRFFSPQDYAFVEVVLDEGGKPVRLDWVIDGNPYPCPRVGDL